MYGILSALLRFKLQRNKPNARLKTIFFFFLYDNSCSYSYTYKQANHTSVRLIIGCISVVARWKFYYAVVRCLGLDMQGMQDSNYGAKGWSFDPLLLHTPYFHQTVYGTQLIKHTWVNLLKDECVKECSKCNNQYY